LQHELNEYEESNILEATAWLSARRRADPLDERFIHVVHGRMFNQTWKWAGKSRRTDKNIDVSWFEIPVRLRQMLGDVSALRRLPFGDATVSIWPIAAVEFSDASNHVD
jgi:fido (protein-threonine AMPylation protein)